MKTILFLLCLGGSALLTCLPAGAQTNDGYIGIYADQSGQSPCASVPQGTGVNLYILATLAGATAGGITGAEFRIEVTDPSGWFISYNAPTGTTQLGSPLDLAPENLADGSGMNIAFSNCQQDSSGKVLLGTLGIFNWNGGPTQLLVKRHSNPPNPNWSCPLYVLCDDPEFTKSCMTPTSAGSCSLSTKSFALSSGDPAYFAASLNGTLQGPPVDPNDQPREAHDLLARMPVLLAPVHEPDIIGDRLFGNPPNKPATLDTLWKPEWTWAFDSTSALCSQNGWKKLDNRILYSDLSTAALHVPPDPFPQPPAP